MGYIHECVFHDPPCTDSDECARRSIDPVSAHHRMRVVVSIFVAFFISIGCGFLWLLTEKPTQPQTAQIRATAFRHEMKKSDVSDFALIREDPVYVEGTYRILDASDGDLRLCGPIEVPIEKREIIRLCPTSEMLDASRAEHIEFVRTQDREWAMLDREWSKR